MGRIRTIKPDFFAHEDLFQAEKDSGLPLRLAYAGLWTAADREGRFKWKPMQLKIAALPHDDVDFSRVLDALATCGFIFKYDISGVVYGVILSWKQHQFINNKEPQSVIPSPPQDLIDKEVDAIATRRARDYHTSLTRGVKEGKGKEDNTPLPPTGKDQQKTINTDADFKPSECAPMIRAALGISGQRNWITSTEAIETHMLAKPGMTAKQSAEEIASLWPIYRASPQYKRFPMNPEKWLSSGEFLRSENWSRSEVTEFPTRASPAVTSTDASELIRERKEKLKAHKATNGKA